jgi:hypothetical protein
MRRDNMSELNVNMDSLSVEVYKVDRRMKVTKRNPNRERLVKKFDIENVSMENLEENLNIEYPADKGYRFEIFNTYVVKKSLMGGNEFVERYDTPYYCSPSSETYWSM